MTIEPTREEWLAVRGRLMVADHPADADAWTEAALGPCPPEPAPPPFYKGEHMLVKAQPGVRLADHMALHGAEAGAWWVNIRAAALTPDEADAMAEALTEHAWYAREQGETP